VPAAEDPVVWTVAASTAQYKLQFLALNKQKLAMGNHRISTKTVMAHKTKANNYI